MARRRLDSRSGSSALLSEIHTQIHTDPMDAVFDMSNELGRGKFAVVKRCVEKATGKVFAAKFIKKRRRGRDCRAEVIHEIAVLEAAKNNPRVVNLHAVYETDHDLVLMLEYAAGGEIFDHCVSEELLPEGQITRLIRQMLEGIHLLHQSSVVHLDLKPQNILLTCLSPLGDIKLVDFGLARRLGSAGELREILGTPEYVAPEILNYEPITTATDLWSVGVIAYMLVTGESPFVGDDKQETFLNVSQVNVDYSREAFSRVSELAVDFIRKLLVKVPEDRPSAADCMTHPWLWLHCPGSDLIPVTPRTPRERSFGGKWSAPPEDPEDKENILDSPHVKRFRFEEDMSATGDGDHLC
ncbi:serine threonine- kinase 17B-like protein [Labeo rohita]|uniref:Serine/threonine-protein kinase 17B n=2 Tax=Labeo rohita TaxID=84645 RepID=A0ABQ8MEE2_LABRO|nr:serine/threonine-protein kinase 17B [Labeo rohita]KAI2660627.1 Serine/threonine-protein kinase 17B [Labeo rohita]RXN29061.1 serine threonine- kinase 17B-like protein [Labeo rohita]